MTKGGYWTHLTANGLAGGNGGKYGIKGKRRWAPTIYPHSRERRVVLADAAFHADTVERIAALHRIGESDGVAGAVGISGVTGCVVDHGGDDFD